MDFTLRDCMGCVYFPFVQVVFSGGLPQPEHKPFLIGIPQVMHALRGGRSQLVGSCFRAPAKGALHSNLHVKVSPPFLFSASR